VLTGLHFSSVAGGPFLPLGELSHFTMGIGGYMSPELAEGAVGLDGLDERADVWAAGVVLHEALSGQRLFPQAAPSANAHF
jgi:hypothetical protein